MPPERVKPRVTRKKATRVIKESQESVRIAAKVSAAAHRKCATASAKPFASKMAAMLWQRGSVLTCSMTVFSVKPQRVVSAIPYAGILKPYVI